jgi:hypothetical protein
VARGPAIGSVAEVARTPLHAIAQAGSFGSAPDERGVPQLVIALGKQAADPRLTVEQAARAHLARHATGLAVSPETIDHLELYGSNDLGARGHLVRFRQRVNGVELFRGAVNVLLRANHELVAISGNLSSETPRQMDRAPFRRSPAEVVSQLAPGVDLYQPARVDPVYFNDRDRLVPAWRVELLPRGDLGVRYVVADNDLRVLHRQSLTDFDTFDYRVFAEANGDKRPLDGPIVDYNPYPFMMDNGSEPAFILPNLVTMEGFNHNPQNMADPWLPANATVSTGNNIDAYTDNHPPDGFSNGDIRATTTGTKVFDRTYDTSQDATASNEQAMAGIMNAFYVTNWLHDWWYDSGFNEMAMNAQTDNFGRGGMGGDPMHVECQDSSGVNNSNMTTPSDGMSPRMQLFVWTGPGHSMLTLTPPGTSPITSVAAFGPTNFNITAPVILVNDGMGTVTDACEAITNNVSGKIALIDRGNCTFKQKVVNAQTAGAVGVIIADNQANNTPPQMGDGTPNTNVTIGVLGIRQVDGNALKTTLMQGAVSATMTRKQEAVRDGTLDNTIVAHEWGHYLHHRLAECGLQQCSAMSEGWGDFTAMHMSMRAGDDVAHGSYAEGTYGSQFMGDAGYFGLRRQPYSIVMSVNGLSFRHIANGQALPNTPMNPNGAQNAEVHNAGEVWATMLFESYVALILDGPNRQPALSFDDMRRRMSDYLVLGLQLTPVDATYTEGRDAILTAAAANDPADSAVMAAAFARRGAGSCAVSPPRDSMDFTGVVESADVKARLSLGAALLDDSERSCDHDGRLDADEQGKLTLQLHNGGPSPMMSTKVTVSTMTMGASFPNGASVDVPNLPPFSTTPVTFDVALDPSLQHMGPLAIQVDVVNPASCEGMLTQTFNFLVNADEVPASSATDNVESATTLWKPTGMNSGEIWSIQEREPLNHVWHGNDFGTISDTWLESPDLMVSANKPFQISFSHRHDFEVGDDNGMMANFDGAVIEVTSDGGMTWTDVAQLGAKPPYGGVLANDSGNPIGGRMALVGKNPMWPMREPVMLDLGMMLAGKTARMRFRIGTDQAAAFTGWDIDDIAFAGIDNTPFATEIDDMGVCPKVMPDMGVAKGDMAGMHPNGDGGPKNGDAGDGGMGTMPDNGCGCHVGARENHRGALLGILLLGWVIYRRRLRKRGV